jgi:two-component system KDP operon response regulator KdpE
MLKSTSRRGASRVQAEMRLTPKEFDLLSYLSARPNRTLTHRELLRAVWGADYGDEAEF